MILYIPAKDKLHIESTGSAHALLLLGSLGSLGGALLVRVGGLSRLRSRLGLLHGGGADVIEAGQEFLSALSCGGKSCGLQRGEEAALLGASVLDGGLLARLHNLLLLHPAESVALDASTDGNLGVGVELEQSAVVGEGVLLALGAGSAGLLGVDLGLNLVGVDDTSDVSVGHDGLRKTEFSLGASGLCVGFAAVGSEDGIKGSKRLVGPDDEPAEVGQIDTGKQLIS